jgi:hypothetical protein
MNEEPPDNAEIEATLTNGWTVTGVVGKLVTADHVVELGRVLIARGAACSYVYKWYEVMTWRVV